jgi:hypothetical protein
MPLNIDINRSYIYGDYFIINNRIIFYICSVLFASYVYTTLYDSSVAYCLFVNFELLLCIYTVIYLNFLNCFSELCKWYTVRKLQKICNFFILKLFLNFQWFKFNFENWKHSKTRPKCIFNLFSKIQIRIMHMIRRWKDTKIAQRSFFGKKFQIRHEFWTILKILEFSSTKNGRTIIWKDFLNHLSECCK